jgi:two-component system nitrate/nitrite sensor histidine kinase NarX
MDAFGGMMLYYANPPLISAEEMELASILGVQAALAIDNAHLKAEAEEAAVTGERVRIARELHDSVTQSLYSASLIAEAVPKVWQKHPQEALRSLEELRLLTQGAQAEMRTLLLELRPGELADRKLSELLRQLTDAMSARTELPISLTVVGDCQLPTDVRIAFYRITQESLNNISKHARASRAWVNLRCDQIRTTIRIGDNGHGFDPESRQFHQLGLKIMHERAEAIGADLTIESRPGQSTEVTVIWQANE